MFIFCCVFRHIKMCILLFQLCVLFPVERVGFARNGRVMGAIERYYIGRSGMVTSTMEPIRYRIWWETQSRRKRTVGNPIRTAKISAHLLLALKSGKELLKSDARANIPVK